MGDMPTVTEKRKIRKNEAPPLTKTKTISLSATYYASMSNYVYSIVSFRLCTIPYLFTIMIRRISELKMAFELSRN